MSRLRKSLTFSNTVALVALFFALGGTVYAASGKISGSQIQPRSLPGNRLKAHSVTGTQIKNGSIGGPQLKSGSISGTQIQPGSLGATQINQTTLTGISAANIQTVQYVTSTVTLVPGAKAGTSATATCPTGMKVIGGGTTLSNKEFGSVLESAPNAERSGWYANGFLIREVGVNMTVTAICTPVAAPVG
jgi:hypothetical protein